MGVGLGPLRRLQGGMRERGQTLDPLEASAGSSGARGGIQQSASLRGADGLYALLRHCQTHRPSSRLNAWPPPSAKQLFHICHNSGGRRLAVRRLVTRRDAAVGWPTDLKSAGR